MAELDPTQASQLLGYSREYFVKVVCKRRDFPKPSTNCSPRKRRWRMADVMRFKEGR
jgi:predicted DNA-binding transcriptional regulator AlpA